MRRLILALTISVAITLPAHACEPNDVSMIQLIAQPATMHGRAIRLTGFMHLEFEGDAVYLHGDDFANDMFKNGLWIDLSDKQRAAASKFNNRYVWVEATFDANSNGHFGMWSGTLRDVTRLTPRGLATVRSRLAEPLPPPGSFKSRR